MTIIMTNLEEIQGDPIKRLNNINHDNDIKLMDVNASVLYSVLYT